VMNPVEILQLHALESSLYGDSLQVASSSHRLLYRTDFRLISDLPGWRTCYITK
jgi:hypothetical protein